MKCNGKSNQLTLPREATLLLLANDAADDDSTGGRAVLRAAPGDAVRDPLASKRSGACGGVAMSAALAGDRSTATRVRDAPAVEHFRHNTR